MAEYSRPDSFMNTETIARGSSPASPPAPAQSHTTPAHPAVQKHLHHTVPARTTHPVRCRFCPSWSRRRCRGAGFLHAERLAPSPVWCDRRPPAESSPAQKSAPVRNVTWSHIRVKLGSLKLSSMVDALPLWRWTCAGSERRLSPHSSCCGSLWALGEADCPQTARSHNPEEHKQHNKVSQTSPPFLKVFHKSVPNSSPAPLPALSLRQSEDGSAGKPSASLSRHQRCLVCWHQPRSAVEQIRQHHRACPELLTLLTALFSE